MMTGSHPYAARAGRCDEPEPPPPNTTMRIAFLILLAVILGLFAAGMTGCVTTKTTDPATGIVTETRAPAPGSMELAGQGLATAGEILVAHRREQKSFTAAEQADVIVTASAQLDEAQSFDPLNFPGGDAETAEHPAAMGYFGPFGSGFRGDFGGISYHR